MILPKGAFMVLQDLAVVKETDSRPSLILSMEEIDSKPKKPNTGSIVFVGEGVEEYLYHKVRFREQFSEVIEVDGIEYLFFRDYNSSIYYATKPD